MTATSTLCYNPSTKFFRTNLPNQICLKNTSFVPDFSASRISFTCAMNGFIRSTPYRDGKSDEQVIVKVLEQEAFVDRSSEFQPKFFSHEVESTLNQLVGNHVFLFFFSYRFCRKKLSLFICCF